LSIKIDITTRIYLYNLNYQNDNSMKINYIFTRTREICTVHGFNNSYRFGI